ncbi:hypothetical protein [Paenibacillus sp. M2]|uniref:hypothetical protein n=1 Tax=Paenibacillus sp. M2 TaxID=3341793 RepID=UPI0039896751
MEVRPTYYLKCGRIDIPELESIYETSRYLHQWDGQEHDRNYVKECFEEGHLPPGGRDMDKN